MYFFVFEICDSYHKNYMAATFSSIFFNAGQHPVLKGSQTWRALRIRFIKRSVSYRTSFHRKLRIKNGLCLVQDNNFFFFSGKILQLQNASATKRFGTKRSLRQNVDTTKSSIRDKKNSVTQTTKKIFWKIKFDFTTRISIEQWLYC